MNSRKALITGITGQDGSYLADLLLAKGYEVHGVVRRVALQDPAERLSRIAHILDRVHLHAGSLESLPSLFNVVESVRPDECYHLGAQSFVSYSLDDEFSTLNSNINGTHHILSSIQKLVPECRFCFAGSSEIFGRARESPQSETTCQNPRSAYGISKSAGLQLTRLYRETHGLHASGAILFNHESPRRGREFVTRKITTAVADIAAGKSKELWLGSLEAKRDWGHAREYVEAMWLMLQQESPDDYVIATGTVHSVGEFAAMAFERCGLDWRLYVKTDPALFRPVESATRAGDASKALKKLGWKAEISFGELVDEMVGFDCRTAGDAISARSN
jgi:GDPmannose 4,6-dehydratase